MLSLSPPDATVHFTSLSSSSQIALSRAFAPAPNPTVPTATAKPHTQDVLSLIKELNIPMERVCLLDPRAEKEIEPEDGEVFDMFLFGGILGVSSPSFLRLWLASVCDHQRADSVPFHNHLFAFLSCITPTQPALS
jgi:hypothetical protein